MHARSTPLIILCWLGLLSGCASINPAEERKQHNQLFTTELERRNAALPSHPLSLDECISIALTNNYTIRKAELDQHLAKLNKHVAFSTFLPQIATSYGYNVANMIPSSSSAMDLHMISASVSMPVFAPTTWFLYGATCDGYASAEIATAYTKQNIILQTSINYYKWLLQSETVKAVESQLLAAQALTNRLDGLAAEGYIMPWEREAARLLVEQRMNDLNQAKRQVTLMKASLLQTLGLSPLAPVTFDVKLPERKRPEGNTVDLILRALETHPELSLADRMIVAKENQVRQAFAKCIPTLGTFAQLQWVDLSSLGDLLPAAASSTTVWMAGFSAAWTVFNGFANYNNLQIAKTERSKSEIEREATFLSVMVRIIAAEASLQDATDNAGLAKRAYLVSQDKVADYEAKAKEGLVPLSDALDARAEMDASQIRFVQAAYVERMAMDSLELAMGIIFNAKGQL